MQICIAPLVASESESDKFHPNPIWNDGALDFLKEIKKINKNNKMNSGMGSVPNPITTESYPAISKTVTYLRNETKSSSNWGRLKSRVHWIVTQLTELTARIIIEIKDIG